MAKIPQSLKDTPHWVCWRGEYRGGNPKLSKIPVNPKSGGNASSTNAATWGGYDQALSRFNKSPQLCGIGFVFGSDDPFVGVDLDHCRNPETGDIEAWAREILGELNTYCEVSPSQTGVKAFLRGGPLPGGIAGGKSGDVEMYQRDRFFTVTGHRLEEYPAETMEVPTRVTDELWMAMKDERSPTDLQGERHAPDGNGSMLSDAEIISRAGAARNGLGFKRLMSGGWSGYPSQSEADSALCCMLAFWSRDPIQIDRIFRQSGLYRDKWDRRHGRETYGNITIQNGLARVMEWWRPGGHGAGKDIDEEDREVLPPPPEFPSGIFHPDIERVVVGLAQAFNVSRTVPVCALLSFSGVCIGRTRGISIKARWNEYPNLYLAIVGKSGSGKSPIVDLLREILTSFEKGWIENYRLLKAQYEMACEGWKIQVDAEKKTAREAAATGCSISISLPAKPEEPKLREIMAEDATLEGVGDMLAANPRGIIWYRDELVGLILDLDKYSGKDGSGRSRLLSAWSSGLWKGTRKDVLKRNFIPYATLSIFGGIQPRLLPLVFQAEDTEAGFTPRFLFARIQRDTPPEWTDETVSDDSVEVIRRLLERFLSWDFDAVGKPLFIGVSREAKSVFVDWFNHQASEPWRDPDAADDDAMLSKLRSYTLRFALILHCMDAVMSGASEMDPVTADQMGRAISLTETFTEHNRQCRRFYSPKEQDATTVEYDPLQKRVMAAIVSLEGEIKQGMLPTARITEKVNAGQEARYQVSGKKIGKVIASLGLSARKSTGGMRVTSVCTRDIVSFKEYIETNATNATNAANRAHKPIYSQNTNATQMPPNATPGSGGNGSGNDEWRGWCRSGITLLPANQHEQRASGFSPVENTAEEEAL